MAKTQRKNRSNCSNRKNRSTRKNQAGGKRRLSPALKAWNEKVMRVYKEMKAKNPSTRLGDAMRAAKKMK